MRFEKMVVPSTDLECLVYSDRFSVLGSLGGWRGRIGGGVLLQNQSCASFLLPQAQRYFLVLERAQ
jgi:hypothetical protein